MVGGRAGGAACGFAQPQASAARQTKCIAVRIEQAKRLYALNFLWDRVITQVTTYRIVALSPTLLIALDVKYLTPEARATLQASSRG